MFESCLRNYERRNVDNTLRLFFVYATSSIKISAQKVTKHLYNLNEAHKLSQAQAQTRVYSYNYTFLLEFVFKLASIAVRQYG